MNSEQIAFFPTDEAAKRQNADAILSSFINWFDALPVTEGDRKPLEWFAREARGYLENPLVKIWSTV